MPLDTEGIAAISTKAPNAQVVCLVDSDVGRENREKTIAYLLGLLILLDSKIGMLSALLCGVHDLPHSDPRQLHASWPRVSGWTDRCAHMYLALSDRR